ncbi:GtrA family protein [Halapricum hydrolyticum]|uniref:GtrA family protein n=1 Tax=Halapricum hydrolyticum TaxID=2979991 RepID=A0AAE3IAF6_9EURY|nr:GtrA family protein [Halapricum hydrolyticum]MCU4717776.1 GtrA family protein [Halapricum hydrolyticum]MCU4726940.1 GtrA family protein [Halapricum hydrolyticum]
MLSIPFRDRLRSLATADRLLQFIAVGTIGASVDMSLLVVFHSVVGLPLVVSKLTGAEISYLVMFVINERWTFSSFGKTSLRARLRRLGTSNGVRLGGLATATTVLVVLTEVAGLWYPLANAIGIGVGFFVNYAFESLLTWRVHRN